MKSVPEQVQDLIMVESMYRSGGFKPVFRVSVILLIVLLALGIYTRLPPYFMIAAFLGLIIYASRKTSTHLSNAVNALSNGQKKSGSVKIEAIYDSNTFKAILQNSTQVTWQFSFIPSGWKPSEGEFPATVYHLQSVNWPVLVEVEDGIMIPREKPELTSKQGFPQRS